MRHLAVLQEGVWPRVTGFPSASSVSLRLHPDLIICSHVCSQIFQKDRSEIAESIGIRHERAPSIASRYLTATLHSNTSIYFRHVSPFTSSPAWTTHHTFSEPTINRHNCRPGNFHHELDVISRLPVHWNLRCTSRLDRLQPPRMVHRDIPTRYGTTSRSHWYLGNVPTDLLLRVREACKPSCRNYPPANHLHSPRNTY